MKVKLKLWTNITAVHQCLCFQLIKLLAEVTNTSTAILYELLLTLHKLIQNNSALKLTKLLEGVAMVCTSIPWHTHITHDNNLSLCQTGVLLATTVQVCWTQHSWIKIDQLHVTCFIISLFTAQHVSNVSTSIFRSLQLIVDLSHGLYCSGSMCVGVTVWFGWGGVVSLCRLKQSLLLNMFWMLVHPSSGACDLLWIYLMCCIALVWCVLVLRCGSAGVVWYPYAGWSRAYCSTCFEC